MTDAEHTRPTERLWTPWRMRYIGGETVEPGCIFCNRLERSNDIESLILLRMEHSFVIMNLYPYNTGHIMLVPNRHASDPADLSSGTLAEMGTVLPTLTNALRRAFDCHGFNVGLNIGAIAGAGVEAHLHQHIVPRWQGDANFMPILASTMTIPELIPVTYAKIRTELSREVTGEHLVRFVLLDEDEPRVLLRDGILPAIEAREDEHALQAIVRELPECFRTVQLAGWAGPDSAGVMHPDDVVLTLVGTEDGGLPAPWRFVSLDDPALDESMRSIIERAVNQRAPSL